MSLEDHVRVQQVRSRMRRIATRAKECADRRRASAPSRAGTLLRRALDCSNDYAACHCARLMYRLLPGRFRRLPVDPNRRNTVFARRGPRLRRHAPADFATLIPNSTPADVRAPGMIASRHTRGQFSVSEKLP